jgi:hypothetical protein
VKNLQRRHHSRLPSVPAGNICPSRDIVATRTCSPGRVNQKHLISKVSENSNPLGRAHCIPRADVSEATP